MANVTPLRKARKNLGWSIYEVADLVGVTPATVSKWECGHLRTPPAAKVRVARVFNARVRDLFPSS